MTKRDAEAEEIFLRLISWGENPSDTDGELDEILCLATEWVRKLDIEMLVEISRYSRSLIAYLNRLS